jgi:hypothetical protein
VATPVVDGEVIPPASPKRRPPAGFPLFRSLTLIPETPPPARWPRHDSRKAAGAGLVWGTGRFRAIAGLPARGI